MVDVPMKVQAAMFLMQKSQISILECEAVAKDMELANSMTFDLVGPTGRHNCRWVDAHYGIFEIIGRNGGYHTKSFQYVTDIHCENIGAD